MRCVRALVLVVTLGSAAGCGAPPPDGSNLSSLARSDRRKHADAVRQTEALARQHREAEARFHAGRSLPNPEPEPPAAAAEPSPSF
jgi:hypothetical protein